LVHLACHIAKAAGQGIIRHNTKPDFVGYKNDLAGRFGKSRSEVIDRLGKIVFGKYQVRCPKGQAIYQQDISRAAFAPYNLCKIERSLNRLPTRSSLSPMPRDAVCHLDIQSLGSRDINQLTRQAFRLPLSLAV